MGVDPSEPPLARGGREFASRPMVARLVRHRPVRQKSNFSMQFSYILDNQSHWTGVHVNEASTTSTASRVGDIKYVSKP
jgi:hypothetical protein